ncbi:EH signature domain-containing protein [Methylovulum psychrotolerans]|uniref:Zorya protein ZorC EH domain-containing protein n=1 Tax=Methylovulum psychrotolerans TaxID=1704499 RepID=A0A1Z4BW01_9GAMM|nr:EH signature domain-containing protein [Methylovulum psychrotolerans]ASF45476.1 hypothetical protein CEK71_05010 [Methylovulum psychrotolerans]
MNSIATFRNRLLQINAEALLTPIPDLSEEMARTTQSLRTEYGDISRGAEDQLGIAAAVIDYLKNHHLSTYRDVKYVCFGVSSPYGTPLTRVIEHETLFSKLLKEVELLQPEPRKFRRCYQGLLKGYLRYPGQQTEQVIGHKNWLALREFLAQFCKALNKQKPVMEWAQALYEHRNLLADNPCKPYGKAMLAGDMSVVEELKSRLGIDDDTWVMKELVLAHVQAAITLKDGEFVSQLTLLIQLLEQHTGMITQGLALLLRRYEQCKEHAEHHALRDMALREWKSPWLESNKPLWYAQIGDAATQMVKLWLTKQHIKDFFVLLQAGGQADTQRMEFWLQYAEAIDDFWLALGNNSFYNQQADFKRIRTQMEGHCMRLIDSNQNNDNAFLMKIGNFVFIEFGKQNNACHIFSADNLPFTIGQTTVSGTGNGLKNTKHSGWQRKLSHFDGWQQEFADFLRSFANASLNKSKYEALSSSTNQSLQSLDSKSIEAFCISQNLHFDDHRDKGGAIWVHVPQTHGSASMLKSAGFRYKEGRGWWRE